jgi:Tfp pilus assembly protein PilF
MKRILLLIILITVTGCASGRENQPQFGKSDPAAYHFQMGVSYLGEGNYTSALFELDAAEKLDPDNPELLYNLGRAYVAKKRPDLAVPKYQKALQIRENYTTARNDLGLAYMELKRWDDAIQQFKIVKDDLFYDNTENAVINLGLAYLGKGDYPKAQEELRTIAAANPRNPFTRLALGRVLFAMDKTELAIIEYKRALDVVKEFGAAYYYLGLAYLKLNNKAAARDSFKEAVRLMPDTDLGHSALEYLDLLK